MNLEPAAGNRRRNALLAIPVDEIDQAVTNTVDSRNVQSHRPHLAFERPSSEFQGAVLGRRSVLYPKRDGAAGRSMNAGEGLSETVRLPVDDEIDAALPEKRYIFRSVPSDCGKNREIETASSGFLDRVR